MEEYYYDLYYKGLIYLIENKAKKSLKRIGIIPRLVGQLMNDQGNGLIHQAVLQSDKTMRNAQTNYLLRHGLEVNSQNSMGNTPLHLALQNEDKPLTYFLLSQHACLFIKNNNGIAPMNLLLANNKFKLILTQLLDAAYIPAKKSRKSKISTYIEQIGRSLTPI